MRSSARGKLVIAVGILAVLAVVAVLVQNASVGSGARAIGDVACDRPGYLRVTLHYSDGPSHDQCFAGPGEAEVDGERVTEIWTGDNRVQWVGEGAWQPETGPIGPNTRFDWPDHPGGVEIDAIKIVETDAGAFTSPPARAARPPGPGQ